MSSINLVCKLRNEMIQGITMTTTQVCQLYISCTYFRHLNKLSTAYKVVQGTSCKSRHIDVEDIYCPVLSQVTTIELITYENYRCLSQVYLLYLYRNIQHISV